METFFAKRARLLTFTPSQRQIVLGTLLGDGHLAKTTRGYALRVHHGAAQYAYALWKYQQLRDFVRTPPRPMARTSYFRTVSHPALADLRDEFYVAAQKVVPLKLLQEEFGPLALAVWFMDDGARDGLQVRFNTQSFTGEEAEALVHFLFRRFALQLHVNADKGRPRLRVRARSMVRFSAIVRPHLHESFAYKLP